MGPKTLLERGDNLEKVGIDIEIGGGKSCHFFITLQLNCIYCMFREKVKFTLLHFDPSIFEVSHARFSS